MSEVRFVIPLATKPCPRPRVTGKNCYYPPTYEQWRRDAALFFPSPLWEGPVWLDVTFHGSAPNADIDNMLKSICDLGTGRLWIDDRQVERIKAEKLPVIDPRDRRTEIKAGRLTPEETEI